MSLVKEHTEAQDYLKKCTNELNEMSIIKFFGFHTYYSLMRKSVNMKKLLSRRIKNVEFLESFEKNLNKFPCFKSDLKRVFDEAIPVREELLLVEDRLKYIFSDYLPDVVVRILAENLKAEDLPLE